MFESQHLGNAGLRYLLSTPSVDALGYLHLPAPRLTSTDHDTESLAYS